MDSVLIANAKHDSKQNKHSKEQNQIIMSDLKLSQSQSTPITTENKSKKETESSAKPKLPKVAIGFPCYSVQPSEWWFGVLDLLLAENHTAVEITTMIRSSSMLRDNNKNKAVEALLFEKKRPSDADINRNIITSKFMESSADYLFFIDDDTLPPKGVMTHLISLGKQFVSGLYFLPSEPYNPIAYIRNEEGFYQPIWNYAKGTLQQVDSVGMGCAMIHRSVFEKIKEEHVIYKRPDGSIFPIHKSQITDTKPKFGSNHKAHISHGIFHIPVEPVNIEEDGRPYPFFALEYSRTEDHFFCEMAEQVGIKPWLDTTIVCQHLKIHGKGYDDYKEELKKMKEKK